MRRSWWTPDARLAAAVTAAVITLAVVFIAMAATSPTAQWHQYDTPTGTIYCYGKTDNLTRYNLTENCVTHNG